jgi:hypothetical protein
MRPRVWTIIVGGALLLGLLPAVAGAQQPGQLLPNVNLGFTSFLDGGPPAGPGFYFQEYIQYYTADRFQDSSGKKIGLLGDLDVVVSLNQFIYQSDQAIVPGGGRWGMDLIVPIVSISTEKGDIPLISSSHEGMGDVVIGPYIQWDPIMGKKGPIFMHRIELQNIVPVGKYDNEKVLNPGANFYSFNPYWAATFFALPQWTITWRLHYLWNDKNRDPNRTLYPLDPTAPRADDTQAGEAIHVNFASEYEVLEKQLRIGINGYYLEQISQSKIDGKGVADWDERVLALGPGAIYSFSQNDHVFFNSYFETEANSRPEGMRFNFRWTHHF